MGNHFEDEEYISKHTTAAEFPLVRLSLLSHDSGVGSICAVWDICPVFRDAGMHSHGVCVML